jgi:hypothetical protein
MANTDSNTNICQMGLFPIPRGIVPDHPMESFLIPRDFVPDTPMIVSLRQEVIPRSHRNTTVAVRSVPDTPKDQHQAIDLSQFTTGE